MTVSIVEFLEARLTEDEAAANAVWPDRGGWAYDRDRFEVRTASGDPVASVARYRTEDGWTHTTILEAEGEHIARHDAARVLREVAAKRAILEYHATTLHEATPLRRQSMSDEQFARVLDAERTLGWLAAVYSDHPEYREEWRP